MGNRKRVYGLYGEGLSVEKEQEETKTSQCFLISRPITTKKLQNPCWSQGPAKGTCLVGGVSINVHLPMVWVT